jgi:proliferating cell nuclear antigen
MSQTPPQSEAADSTETQFTIRQERLATFVSNARTLVDEAKIRLEEDGLALRAVDPSNVGMVSETLSKEAFESYHAGNGEGVLGINLERVSDVLGMGSGGDLVHAELDDETRKLHWSVDSLEYTQALIDPDSIRQEPDIPELDLPAVFDLPGSELSRAVKAANMVADHIRFGFDPEEDEAVFEADGDTDSVEVVVDADRDLEVIESGEANSLFSNDYLDDLQKAYPNSGSVRVELGEEFPVKTHFEFAEGHGDCTFMLAPRIQSQ